MAEKLNLVIVLWVEVVFITPMMYYGMITDICC